MCFMLGAGESVIAGNALIGLSKSSRSAAPSRATFQEGSDCHHVGRVMLLLVSWPGACPPEHYTGSPLHAGEIGHIPRIPCLVRAQCLLEMPQLPYRLLPSRLGRRA